MWACPLKAILTPLLASRPSMLEEAPGCRVVMEVSEVWDELAEYHG